MTLNGQESERHTTEPLKVGEPTPGSGPGSGELTVPVPDQKLTRKVLEELQHLGSDRQREIYRRHGAGENLFGVSLADLRTLKQKIRVDHSLARRLWETGNHDARVLAILVADLSLANEELLESWVQDLRNGIVADAFAGYVSSTSLARIKMEQWVLSDTDWVQRTGWQVLAQLALRDRGLPDSYFEIYLALLEEAIPTSPVQVRSAMNAALVAIGLRSERLGHKASRVAQANDRARRGEGRVHRELVKESPTYSGSPIHPPCGMAPRRSPPRLCRRALPPSLQPEIHSKLRPGMGCDGNSRKSSWEKLPGSDGVRFAALPPGA